MKEPVNHSYPKYLFYKDADGAIQSLRVVTEDQDRALHADKPDTYFNSPAEAEKGEIIVVPGRVAVAFSGAGRPLGYVPKEYPKTVFKHLGGGKVESKIVNDPIAHAAQGAEWFESPTDAVAGSVTTPVILPVIVEADPTLPSVAPSEPLTDAGIVPMSDEHAAELYATTVPEAAEAIATCPDVSTLKQILAAEQANPKGARKGVVAAVNNRLAELAG